MTGLVVYGLSEKPANLTVPWQEEPIPVTEDFADQAFYEADLDRMQATDLLLDLCSDDMRSISWQL